VVCNVQIHFDSTQFEPRRSDKKLKSTAVPTVFSHSIARQPTARRPLKRTCPFVTPQKTQKKPAATATAVEHAPTRDHTYADLRDVAAAEQRKSFKSSRADHTYTSYVPTASHTSSATENLSDVTFSEYVPTASDTSSATENLSHVTFSETSVNVRTKVSSTPTYLLTKLRQQVRSLQRENAQLKAKMNKMSKTLGAFLHNDQIQQLQGSRSGKWTSDTVRMAIKIRTATGKNGYEYLRTSVGYPLPSYRTLCERLESVKMMPGIQTDVLELLKLKTDQMIDREKQCVLILDEVQIKRKIEYDTSAKVLTGYVHEELGNTTEEASHALVFMVKGLCRPYKQVVAWYLTGTGTRGDKLWSVTLSVLKQLYEASLIVRVVTSDMGGSNVGMWKSAGLDIHSNIDQCCIPHPCDERLVLYFMADVPHLLKNLRSCLEKYPIALPEQVVLSHGLTSHHADMSHIESVVSKQDKVELKLAPGLSDKVVHPGQYGKMKVNCATKIFSHSTAAALTAMASNGTVDSSAHSTAWLCETINQWFDIMSNRLYKAALFEHGGKVAKLQNMMMWIKQLQVVGKQARVMNALKPWQKGMILSTNTVLALHKELVVNGDYTFLLTCRLTQDCLENLFSQIRGLGDSHPSVVRFRICLKHITVSQLLSVPKTTSYDVDSLPNLVDFIRSSKCDQLEQSDCNDVQQVVGIHTQYEQQALYYLCGWVAHKLTQNISCAECKQLLLQSSPSLKCSDFTSNKSYGGLKHPTKELFKILQVCENFFCAVNHQSVTVDQLVSRVVNSFDTLMSCSIHGPLTHKAVQRYLKLRMHIHAQFITDQMQKKAQYASRSAVARTTIK